MRTKPLISVIVSVYNYERYVRDCIRSILTQEYDPFELIIVDDCSTDGSLEIIQEFESDPRVRVLTTSVNSGGNSVGKNLGIVAARGELLALIDADDMMAKDALTVREAALHDKNVDFVCGYARNVGRDMTLEQAYALTVPFSDCRPKARRQTHAQTTLYKRSLHCELGLYDELTPFNSDSEMWLRFFDPELKERRVSRYFVPALVAFYRIHRRSFSSRRNRRITRKQLRVAREKRLRDGITPDNTTFLEL